MKDYRSNIVISLALTAILLASKFHSCLSVSDNRIHVRRTLLDIKNTLSNPYPSLQIPAKLNPGHINSKTTAATPAKLRKRGEKRRREK